MKTYGLSWENVRQDEWELINNVILSNEDDQKRVFEALSNELEHSSDLAHCSLQALDTEGFVMIPRSIMRAVEWLVTDHGKQGTAEVAVDELIEKRRVTIECEQTVRSWLSDIPQVEIGVEEVSE